MTKIYLIRHAEAEGNLYRRNQGHFNGRITALGRKQIAALAERFRDVRIDALYSSDLCRASTTAGAILKYHPELNLNLEPRLREICMGVWEDKAFGNLAHYEAPMMQNFTLDPDNWHVEGAETFADVTERMLGIIRALAEAHGDQTLAVVSHGMAIRSLLCAVMDIPANEPEKVPHLDNTAVSLLYVENGGISVTFYNDNSHLPEEISTFARQSWWKNKSGDDGQNLRFEPMDLEAEAGLYIRCYADTWKIAHGSLEGFNPDYYLAKAKEHAKGHPEAVMKALRGERLAGVIDLDLAKAKEQDAGWISLCTLTEGHRNQRLGVQLIGHAVSVFRRLGRKSVRLNVARANINALGFYERYGFRKIGRQEGIGGDLFLMELPI